MSCPIDRAGLHQPQATKYFVELRVCIKMIEEGTGTELESHAEDLVVEARLEVLTDLIPVTKAQIDVEEAVRHDVFVGLSSDKLITQRLCVRPPPGESVGHAKRADEPRCTLRYRNDPLERINRTLLH